MSSLCAAVWVGGNPVFCLCSAKYSMDCVVADSSYFLLAIRIGIFTVCRYWAAYQRPGSPGTLHSSLGSLQPPVPSSSLVMIARHHSANLLRSLAPSRYWFALVSSPQIRTSIRTAFSTSPFLMHSFNVANMSSSS